VIEQDRADRRVETGKDFMDSRRTAIVTASHTLTNPELDALRLAGLVHNSNAAIMSKDTCRNRKSINFSSS
jgi:hypothetical protein